MQSFSITTNNASVLIFIFIFRRKCDFLREDKRTAAGKKVDKLRTEVIRRRISEEVVLEGINSLKK